MGLDEICIERRFSAKTPLLRVIGLNRERERGRRVKNTDMTVTEREDGLETC